MVFPDRLADLGFLWDGALLEIWGSPAARGALLVSVPTVHEAATFAPTATSDLVFRALERLVLTIVVLLGKLAFDVARLE